MGVLSYLILFSSLLLAGINVINATGCNKDDYEPNNVCNYLQSCKLPIISIFRSFAQLTDVEDQTIGNLIACDLDSDWFQVILGLLLEF
jgi:hypothetical protein